MASAEPARSTLPSASTVVTGKENIIGQSIIGFEIVKQLVSPVPAGCRFTKKSRDSKWFGHHDININVSEKTPVYAIANGYVVCSQKYTVEGGQKYLVSYGNCINFTSDDINGKTYTAVYAHLSRYAVPGVEQVIPSSSTKKLSSTECKCQTEYLNDGKAVRVKVGDIIGYIGTTGNSTGDYLHFEVYENGKRLDPVDLFPELI